jgi:hypothetical protein
MESFEYRSSGRLIGNSVTAQVRFLYAWQLRQILLNLTVINAPG